MKTTRFENEWVIIRILLGKELLKTEKKLWTICNMEPEDPREDPYIVWNDMKLPLLYRKRDGTWVVDISLYPHISDTRYTYGECMGDDGSYD